MRTSLTNGRANHSCQQAPAISQDQRSAAAAFRGRTVVQPRVCLKKRKACSTVKRRKYQRHSVLRSVGNGPPIQANHRGRGGSFLLGRRSTWTRTTLKGGGKTEVSVNQCAKDALTYFFFLRRELAQGRLVPRQKVYYGAGYDVRTEFMGTQTIRIADGAVQADRIVGTIKGPAAEFTVEMFFARDAARTPLLISVPLTLGKFSMEIVR